MCVCVYREAPVDVGNLDVEVEAEDEEEDAGDHEGAAADELKEVDTPAGRAQHDGLNADEPQQGQHLAGGERPLHVMKRTRHAEQQCSELQLASNQPQRSPSNVWNIEH